MLILHIFFSCLLCFRSKIPPIRYVSTIIQIPSPDLSNFSERYTYNTVAISDLFPTSRVRLIEVVISCLVLVEFIVIFLNLHRYTVIIYFKNEIN